MTAQGPAVLHVHEGGGDGLLVLGHGAGGGVDAPDLRAVTAVATSLGASVVLVEQPYRVAGRRVPPRAPALDEAWCAVLAAVRADLSPARLVVGGRSAGARTACRTARDVAADAVLCLAFPVRPPGRPDAPDRLGELDAVTVPALVVQGARDPYGMPASRPGLVVVVVDGDHSLRKGLPAVEEAVRTWLTDVLPGTRPQRRG